MHQEHAEVQGRPWLEGLGGAASPKLVTVSHTGPRGLSCTHRTCEEHVVLHKRKLRLWEARDLPELAGGQALALLGHLLMSQHSGAGGG